VRTPQAVSACPLRTCTRQTLFTHVGSGNVPEPLVHREVQPETLMHLAKLCGTDKGVIGAPNVLNASCS
jgi:hypothetical protein